MICYMWLIYLGSGLHFTKIFNAYIYLVVFQTLNDHFRNLKWSLHFFRYGAVYTLPCQRPTVDISCIFRTKWGVQFYTYYFYLKIVRRDSNSYRRFSIFCFSFYYDIFILTVIIFLPLLRRFNRIEPVVEKSVIL